MKDSIKSSYITWLNQRYSSTKDHSTRQLIQKISEASSIEQLITLFSKHLEPEMIQYSTIIFCSQLSSWKQQLEDIVLDHPKAIAILNEILITNENKELLLLLKEILNTPELLLHDQMSSLLHILCNRPLPDLIPYIIHIPKVVPIPSSPSTESPGTQNPQEITCIALLNNLSAADKKNALWPDANNLLRSALMMYQELEMFEICLVEVKPLEKKIEPEDRKYCCTVS